MQGLDQMRVPRLTATNWKTWVEMMETALQARGVWGAVSDSESRPSKMGDEQQEWDRNDAVARMLIMSALDDTQFQYISGVRTAQLQWEKLTAVHESKGSHRIATVMAEFYSFQQTDESIDEAASRLTRLQAEIAGIDKDEAPSDWTKQVVLLNGLSENYRTVMLHLQTLGRVSFEDAVAYLKDAEERNKRGQTNFAANDAARSVQGPVPRKSSAKKLTCWHCNRDGHRKSQCKEWLATSEGRIATNKIGYNNSRQVLPQRFKQTKTDGSHHHAAAIALQDSQVPEDPDSYNGHNAWGTFEKVPGGGVKPVETTNDWYIDSAATAHMTNNKDLFFKIDPCNIRVTVANDGEEKCNGRGPIEIHLQGRRVTVNNVLWVPGLVCNLLSMSQLQDRDINCTTVTGGMELMRRGKLIARAKRVGQNYVLHSAVEVQTALHVGDGAADYNLWHRRFGHIGQTRMQHIAAATLGIKGKLQLPPARASTCEPCKLSKSIRVQSRVTPARTTRRLERVYSDFWGPYRTASLSGALYMLTFTDDYSRKSWIYLTKARSELYGKFTEFAARVELETGERIRAIRCDNGSEYRKLEHLLAAKGISMEYTTTYTPEQNGVAERLNRSITTTVRSLLADANLPDRLWGEAAVTANYLRNRAPSLPGSMKTPEEMWNGQKPLVSHLKVFGCIAYAYVPAPQRGKLDNTSMKCVFVGYEESTRQYRVYDPIKKTVERSSHLEFDEFTSGGSFCRQNGEISLAHNEVEEMPLNIDDMDTEILIPTETFDQPSMAPQLSHRLQEVADHFSGEQGTQAPQEPNTSVIAPSSFNDPERMDKSEDPNHLRESGQSTAPTARNLGNDGNAIRRSERSRRPTDRAQNAARRVNYTVEGQCQTPKTYSAAMLSPEKRHWQAAIKDELTSLLINETWELVDRPSLKNVITSKWVFKVKYLPSGQIDKYKARVVARGFTQQYGTDYEETFAPVVRMEALRALFAIAAREDLEIQQMDVISAYLAGELTEELYMEAPQGLFVNDQDNRVCKLQKGLYGLKQSGRLWNKKLGGVLENLGLKSIPADHSIWRSDGGDILLAVYVDDILLFGKDMQSLQRIKDVLNTSFRMKDLGAVNTMLSLNVIRNRQARCITLDQNHYVRNLLEDYDHHDCKAVSTPADGYDGFGPCGPNDARINTREYQAIIGRLNWLVRGTRPDLAFVVHRLSQHCQDPGAKHWSAVKRVLRYLQHSQSLAIVYSTGNLIGYSDADYAADSQDRRSTMGYVFMLSNGAITWASRKQRSVSTSTTEAEYVGLCAAAKEAIWLRSLLSSLRRTHYSGEGATTIKGDNQSSLALIRNPEYHARSKHIDVQYHYIRELVEDQLVRVEYVATAKMIADCLTKPLKQLAFEANLKGLGLIRTGKSIEDEA